MNKQAKIIRRIREKLLAGEYEFADPHFPQEMLNDRLNEVVGKATDGRQISVICRIKENGNLLFITTWEIYG